MGLPHGLGIAEFASGAAYCGEWYLGDRHGCVPVSLVAAVAVVVVAVAVVLVVVGVGGVAVVLK